MTGLKRVVLGALATAVAEIEVTLKGDKKVHPVFPISGVSAQRIAVAQEGSSEAEQIGSMMAAAREAVPSLTDEEFATLSPEEIFRVVGLSRGQLEQVERQISENAAGKS